MWQTAALPRHTVVHAATVPCFYGILYRMHHLRCVDESQRYYGGPNPRTRSRRGHHIAALQRSPANMHAPRGYRTVPLTGIRIIQTKQKKVIGNSTRQSADHYGMGTYK
jgi:hypothetical protein